MATLNQFQIYSQGENTITNNILLMLSLLYELSPKYYEEYISGLINEGELYQIIPVFSQQVNNQGNGYIDGHITLKSSSIIIETKIDSVEWIEKLLKYTSSYRNEDTKLLFHLSKRHYDQNIQDEIRIRLKSGANTSNIQFYSFTFEEFLSQLKQLYQRYNYDSLLLRLYTHFESYCQIMGLLPVDTHMLRAMACGQSYDLNVKYQFYFDLASRGYSQFKYFGIYTNKAVRHIGLVENMIVADWGSDNTLLIKESTHDVTDAQRQRLIQAMTESMHEGWAVEKDHRFFLLKDFHETYYQKVSLGGIFRVRYFNLKHELGENMPLTVVDIAEELRLHTWE